MYLFIYLFPTVNCQLLLKMARWAKRSFGLTLNSYSQVTIMPADSFSNRFVLLRKVEGTPQ